ncbi:MAG: hypothetical protein GFH27_549311n64 [Chloroflexi bacterium AL-W]|nr:hypothetical protein [Chloroflexi bacterium AL-N1]NOK68758.1 hypothetical protein [Chloroflexi bacterium AL-N10]NOK76244.1 hypothetical protein [Chloroflexi bacterium AL-N5]NOK84119.1 hypothetical protein [Chloroflexi bacterium AL-W]NOK91382.1 hypothetical protein [Chloroflexi bacterium AL-N15]
MNNNVNRRQFMALTSLGAASIATAIAAEATEANAAKTTQRETKLRALVVHNTAGDIQTVLIIDESAELELGGKLELLPNDGEQVLRADIADFGFTHDPDPTPWIERQGIMMEEFRVVEGRVTRR